MKKIFEKSKGTLDQEWIDLILNALEAGMSPQEIKEFFENWHQL